MADELEPVTELIPTRGMDEFARLRRVTHAVNWLLGIGATEAEEDAGVRPVNFAYEQGNVLRYGTNTVPGTTDMTAAIQAAVNVVNAAGGGEVYIPPGTYIYHVASPSYGSTYNGTAIKVPYSNVVLRGAGRGVTILKAQGSAGAYGAIQFVTTPVTNGTPAIFRSAVMDMTIDGNYDGTDATDSNRAPVIYGAGTYECVFANLHIKNCGHYAIGLQNGGHIGTVVRDCIFENCVRDAIDVKNNINSGSSLSVGKGLQFRGLHFRNCCRGGDATDPFAWLDVMSHGVVIDDCHFYDFPTDVGVPADTDAAIRVKPGLDADGTSRGDGAQYSIINNIYIHSTTASRDTNAAIKILAPYVVVSNAIIRGIFDSGVNAAQPYCSVSDSVIDGPDVGVNFSAISGTAALYPFANGGHNCSVTHTKFLNTPTGISTSRDDTIVAHCLFDDGVSTNCISASGSRLIAHHNDCTSATASTKISISGVGGDHTIFNNRGVPGLFVGRPLDTGFTIMAVRFDTSMRFFSGYDGTTDSAREQLRLEDVASAVNYVRLLGSATGDEVLFSAGGTDTNISVELRGKGTGEARLCGNAGQVGVAADATGIAFYGGTPVAKPTVTGSRGGNAALQSLLTALASQGLITDSSS